MAKEHSGISDQRKAALKRKSDARALLRQGPEHARGAMYLGGYAIECKIKAIAMEVHRCHTLDELRRKLSLNDSDVYTHGLESLIGTVLPGGVLQRLMSGSTRQSFASYVNRWRPSWRYDPSRPDPEHASAFLTAVDDVYTWLSNNVC